MQLFGVNNLPYCIRIICIEAVNMSFNYLAVWLVRPVFDKKKRKENNVYTNCFRCLHKFRVIVCHLFSSRPSFAYAYVHTRCQTSTRHIVVVVVVQRLSKKQIQNTLCHYQAIVTQQRPPLTRLQAPLFNISQHHSTLLNSFSNIAFHLEPGERHTGVSGSDVRRKPTCERL